MPPDRPDASMEAGGGSKVTSIVSAHPFDTAASRTTENNTQATARAERRGDIEVDMRFSFGNGGLEFESMEVGLERVGRR